MSTNHDVPVWLVEDNEPFRRRLAKAIDQLEGLDCQQHFGTLELALAQLNENTHPEVLLLDIGLPGIDGISGLPQLKTLAPDMKVVILTVFDDHDRVFRALCAGADGYLLKTSPVNRINEAISEVVAGHGSFSPQIARMVLDHFSVQRQKKSADPNLTGREQDVLGLVVRGFTKKEIANQLTLSQHTVDSHMRNIYQKLHVNNRAGAVAAALRDGLVDTDDGGSIQ